MLRSAGVQIGFRSFWHRVERYPESRAEAAATALGFDCATVKIDKMFGNGEPQSKAAELAGQRRISLLEGNKQGSEPLAFNSNPLVGNFEMEAARVVVERADGDLSTARREFHGVVDQIPKHLLEPGAVSKDAMLF